MILAAEFAYPQTVSLFELREVHAIGCRHVVLSNSHMLTNSLLYREWLLRSLEVSGSFFVIVQLPIHFLGTTAVTDDIVTRYICFGSPEVRKRVFGVHLMAGLLTVQDYLLRLYGLLRSGLTYFLIVDDLSAYEGTYKDHAYDAAAAVWTQVTTREHVPVICRVTTLWQFLRCIASHKVQFVVVPYESLLRRKRWARIWQLFVN